MVIFLAYEIWAFPCRLALVNKHNEVYVLLVDAVVDFAFLVDMALKLRTKIPAGTYQNQEEEISRPLDIAAAYFRHVFPFEILPSGMWRRRDLLGMVGRLHPQNGPARQALGAAPHPPLPSSPALLLLPLHPPNELLCASSTLHPAYPCPPPPPPPFILRPHIPTP
eukprot:303803-Rhodomonas_salina.2